MEKKLKIYLDTSDYESLREVWEMKENAYKAFIDSGKDYLEYIYESTNQFIRENKIKYRAEIDYIDNDSGN